VWDTDRRTLSGTEDGVHATLSDTDDAQQRTLAILDGMGAEWWFCEPIDDKS